MIKIGTERDQHTVRVVNRRSNAKPNDQCHYFFERPAGFRKLAQEFVAGLLRRWPDPAGSLTDQSSNDALRKSKYQGKGCYLSDEMKTYRGDMR